MGTIQNGCGARMKRTFFTISFSPNPHGKKYLFFRPPCACGAACTTCEDDETPTCDAPGEKTKRKAPKVKRRSVSGRTRVLRDVCAIMAVFVNGGWRKEEKGEQRLVRNEHAGPVHYIWDQKKSHVLH